ncbi:type IX secretion system protein PorQ [Bacteroidota bacterium]
MKKTIISFLFILFLCSSNMAQISGDGVYLFLKLNYSARESALGGNLISVKDNDLSLITGNPSLLNAEMDNNILLSYINYFANVNYGLVSYAKDYGKLGTFAVGIQYNNYGEFVAANPTGVITGEFTSAEYALNISWAKQITKRLSIGTNIKPIYSVLESYESFGFASDLGITYSNKDNGFTAALVARNMGLQITPYYSENTENLPFEMQAGISKKLAHAPFRLSVIARNVQKWNLTYYNESVSGNIDPTTGLLKSKSGIADFSDKLMRHMIFGVEFLPSESFMLRLGYNYRRHKELKLTTQSGFSGFSFGLGIKLAAINISYSRANYHVAAASNIFTISTNISELYSRE